MSRRKVPPVGAPETPAEFRARVEPPHRPMHPRGDCQPCDDWGSKARVYVPQRHDPEVNGPRR